MKLYKHIDILSYGSDCKYFTLLYNRLLAEYGNYTVSISFAKAHCTHNNEDCFKNHIITMGLLAKYVSRHAFLTQHGITYLYQKIQRSSFHLSAKMPFPNEETIIPMKRMYIKLGKVRVDYKGMKDQR